MTMREDLDRLAGECEVCAMNDEGSVYHHMLNCPSCQEHSLKAEEIQQELQRMTDLSTDTEEDRRHRMGYDVIDVIQMTEAQRMEALRDLFDNLGEMNERQRRAIIRTHTDLLLSLPKEEREKMVRTTRQVYASLPPDRLARERRSIDGVAQAYGPIKRRLVRRLYNGVLPG